MARSGERGRVVLADEPEPEDPWGPEEDTDQLQASQLQHQQQQLAMPRILVQQPRNYVTQRTTPQTRSSNHPSAPGSAMYSSRSPTSRTSSKSTSSRPRHQQLQQQQILPSLQKLCLGVLGRHVTELVKQLDGQLGFMPAEAKAALLAVARYGLPSCRCKLQVDAFALLIGTLYCQIQLFNSPKACSQYNSIKQVSIASEQMQCNSHLAA